MKSACALLTIVLLVLAAPADATEGGTFVYGEFKAPLALDPVSAGDPVSVRLAELAFDGLVSFSEKGEVVPALAERWELSPNGLVFTFYLRDGISWHDGTPVTAEDVAFTYELIRNPETPTPLRDGLGFLGRVSALDSKTVRFSLKHPVYNALGRFSLKILPRHILGKPVLKEDDPFRWTPVGNGPFVLDQVSQERWVIYTGNQDYYRSTPSIERIVMRHFLDRNIMTESLLTHGIDSVVSVQPRDIGRIRESGQFFLKDYNSLSFSFVAFNCSHPILGNRAVRQALTHAVDRQQMLDVFFYGKGKVISGPFAPGSYAYNPGVEVLSYDPVQSRALLSEQGFTDTNGDGMWESDGKPLKLVLSASITDPAMRSVCVALQDYYQEVGVELELEFLERKAWESRVLREHDFEMTVASWVFDDASDISPLFHSGSTGSYGHNFVLYRNPYVDELLGEFVATLDPETRRSINYRLHSILNVECPYLYLWTLTRYAAFSNRVRNVKIDAYSFFPYVQQWYLEE